MRSPRFPKIRYIYLEGEFGGIRQYCPFPRVQPRASHLGHQVVNDVDASISKNELKAGLALRGGRLT